MKVFIAKILVESIYCNSCSVETFDTFDKARDYAKSEIYAYACGYEGEVTEEYTRRFTMQSANTLVTIEIEKHEVK